MKTTTFLNLLFLFVIGLAGCASIHQTLTDNEFLSYVVIKDSVAQYIDKKGGDKKARAGRFLKATAAAETFIDNNPTATIGTVIDTAKLAVNYDGLSMADRLLIDDLLMLIRTSLDKEQTAKKLPDEYVVDMRKIIGAVKAGASIFL